MIELDTLQAQLRVWFDHNLRQGSTDEEIPLQVLGMAEEVGEVCHALLKFKQKIRGYEGYAETAAEMVDGICDTFVFGLVLLSLMGYDVEEELEKVIKKVLKRNWKEEPHQETE